MDLIGKQIGNYVVKKQLGAGGMGTVYICEHPLLGRKVALKVLHEEHARDPSTVERFFNEAKATNSIHHPNIVDVHDFGWLPASEGQPAVVYLVMELLDGQSLAAANASLSIEDALHVTRQCCRALAASHAKGIVHRDLKPENIFLVAQGDDPRFVKIVDFGIAKLMAPGQGGKTQIGMILGTPAYMSPEQCEGRGLVDHRADVYALGVVLYEMLTKRLPFQADNFAALALAHMTQAPTPPSQINPKVTAELDALVLHAMEKSADRRFQSMGELLTALDDPATHLLSYQHLRAEQPTLHAARSGATLIVGVDDVVGRSPQTSTPTPPPPSNETLQHAAAQIEVAVPPPGRRRGLFAGLAGGAAVAAVAAGVIAIASTRGEGPASQPIQMVAAPAPPVSPVPPAAPAPAPLPDAAPARQVVVPEAVSPVVSILIAIETTPPGARVMDGERTVGTTPVSLPVTRGAPALQLVITRDGFDPERLTVGTDVDQRFSLVLRPAPPAPKKSKRRLNPDLKPLEL